MNLLLIPPHRRLSSDSLQPLALSRAAAASSGCAVLIKAVAVDMVIAQTTFGIESMMLICYGYSHSGSIMTTLYCSYLSVAKKASLSHSSETERQNPSSSSGPPWDLTSEKKSMNSSQRQS